MRIVLFLLVLCAPLLACGCFTREVEHDLYHWRTMEDDLSQAHRDLDLLYR